MPINTPSVWQPIAAANNGVPTGAYLAGIKIPVPQDGIYVWVIDPAGGGPSTGNFYILSLLSGAIVDGFNVIETSIGGLTRWIRYASGGGISGITIEDEGVPIGNNPKSTLNFTGAGVTAIDSGGEISEINIPGSSGDTNRLLETGLTTTGIGSGDAAYVSSASTVSKTDATADASSQLLGFGNGVAGQLITQGVVSNAKFTIDGGSPANGAIVYLALGTADGGAGAGKLTATAPVAAGQFVAPVAICVDNSNYAGAKNCVVNVDKGSVTGL